MNENISTVTTQNFREKVETAADPVIVDFWAPWCGPCRMIAPELEAAANEIQGKARISKVNVDDNGELASRFGVQSIPTLIVFKDGKEVNRVVGLQSRKQIVESVLSYA